MPADDADTVHYRLRRQSRTPAWLALSWRALVALGLNKQLAKRDIAR